MAVFVWDKCFQKRAKAIEDVEADEERLPEETVKESDRKPLPPNLSFAPFLKEGYLRILGISLLLVSSLALAARFLGILYGDTLGISIKQANAFGKALDSIHPIGFLLALFLKLTGQQKGNKVAKSALVMLAIGWFFLIAESVFLAKLQSDDLLGALISERLPGNIFWSIGLFMLASTFLFVTPQNLEGQKGKLLAYRLLSIVPLLYFVFTFILASLSKQKIIELPLGVSLLFVKKNPTVAIFAFLYLYGSFFLRLLSKRRYGNTEPIFRTSNQFLWARNILAASIALFVGLLDLDLGHLEGPAALGFGKNIYILTLIPFFLLFRERLPKKNAIQNALFTFGNALSSFLSYIIIFITLGTL